ncbi:MAG: DNA polymerase IV [Candidatus Nanohaloarchaea archaeon]
MSYIGHLDLDAFFAKAETLRRPELKGRPVVVCVYTRNEHSGAVSTSNYQAREHGIGSGMSVAEARSKAPEDTVFLETDHAYYRHKSSQVMEILERHAGETYQTSIDEAFFRLENPQKAEEIRSEVRELGLTASIGMGANRLVAKMASEEDKPDGFTFIPPEDTRDFMAGKDVSEVPGIGDATTRKLEDIGIETCRDLRESNNMKLVEKFGKNRAADLKQKSIGAGPKEFEKSERKQASRIRTMSRNSSDPEFVRRELKKAVEDLMQRISGEKAFRTVTFIAIDSELDTFTRSRSVDTSESEAVLMDNATRLMEDFLAGHSRELRRVGARVSDLVDRKKQKSLQRFR